MKIKLLTPWADENESHAFGDVVERPDAIANEWIAAGIAIEAPAEDIAAQRLRDLGAALDDARGQRDGLSKQIADARAAAEAAKKAAEGAAAETTVHKQAADAARDALLSAREANDALKADFARAFGDAKAAFEAKLADATTARDEFKRQAETLAEQIATLQSSAGAKERLDAARADLDAARARIADLETQLAAASAPKSRKAAAASEAAPAGDGAQ